MPPRSRAFLTVIGFAVSVAACGGEDSDSADDPLLEGLDEPVLLTEADLDALFPLVEPVEPEEDEAPHAVVDGGTLEARLAAYVPTVDPALRFNVRPNANIPEAFVEQAKRGILFGMDNFDSFLPGFSMHAEAAARPFEVVFFDELKPDTGFRASVTSCPNRQPTEGFEVCLPRLNIPYQVVAGVATPIRAGTFVHEVAHLGDVYHALSRQHIDAGGLVLGAFRHSEFRWRREGSAQFITGHAPDAAAYERLGNVTCAFDVLRRGMLGWKDFSPIGNERYLPYQAAIAIDQVNWHRFDGDQTWLLRWWVARPDERDPTRPESAARALVRMISANEKQVDLARVNKLFVLAGLDLYVHGRNPWTARTLSEDCFRAGSLIQAATPGTASLTLPPLSFDAVRLQIGADALADASSLKLELTSDSIANVRAFVYAVDVDAHIACLEALSSAQLGVAQPRQACNDQHVIAIGPLSASNQYRRTFTISDANKAKLATYDIAAVLFHTATGPPLVPVTATLTATVPARAPLTVTVRHGASSPDHVRFFETGTSAFAGARVDVGSSGVLTIPDVAAGDDIGISVATPSDDGPKTVGSIKCKLSDNPTAPTVTYAGGLSCSGF